MDARHVLPESTERTGFGTRTLDPYAKPPESRIVLLGARVTLRQPATEEPSRGRTSDPDIQARELLRRRALVTGVLAEHTGRSGERVEADLDRLTVLDAPAAVEYGLPEVRTPMGP
ncbi:MULTISPECIES: ATP-dependent Clp protease proteolytic subunit [unclassified Streptomyces]|uniref:ATP-dependent Clp protease proteolytic subunit n=1 Tax=unclassified Streptomyces TaxID=2593676 RepID=UPI0033AC514D